MSCAWCFAGDAEGTISRPMVHEQLGTWMTERDAVTEILVAGAINTDLVVSVDRAPEAGETVTGASFATFGGGKGANQAVAAARSGVSVVLLGAIGRDDFGKSRLADLNDDGIDTEWVKTRANAASGVALITVETHGENRIAYVPGATATITADDAVTCIERVRPCFLLVPNELNPVALLALCRAAREIGTTVILNAAPDPESAITLLPFVDILIVNRGESMAMARLERAGSSLEQVALMLQAQGPSKVVITMGGDGAIGLDGEHKFVLPAMHVKVVDTTGAGDTFCGALAASLARGIAFQDAAAYASVAGAISVTRAGAQASIPTRSEIERFLAEVPVDPFPDHP